jgi:hypothetical protein
MTQMKRDADIINLSYEKRVRLIELLYEIEEILPKKPILTPKERRDISSMGIKRQMFAENVLSACIEDKDRIPHIDDIEDLNESLLTTLTYKEIIKKMEFTSRIVNDLYILEGAKTSKIAKTIKKKLESLTIIYSNIESTLSKIQ